MRTHNIKPDRTLYDIARQWDLHPSTVFRYAKKLGLTEPGKINDLLYEEAVILEHVLRHRPRPGRKHTGINDGVCGVAGCFTPAHARGWCNYHYEHWRLYGHPTEKRVLYKCNACGEMRDRKARGMCNRCLKRQLVAAKGGSANG